MCRHCDGYFTNGTSDPIPTEPLRGVDLSAIFGVGSVGYEGELGYEPVRAELVAFDFHTGDMVLCSPIRYCPMCGRRLWGRDDETRG